MTRSLLPRMWLTVTDGLYEGAGLGLSARRASVGSGLDNPVVLTGSGLGERHFALKRPLWPFGRLRIQALDGPITVNNRTPLAPGQWTLVTRGAEIEAAGHRFGVAHDSGALWPILLLATLAAAAFTLAAFVPFAEIGAMLLARF